MTSFCEMETRQLLHHRFIRAPPGTVAPFRRRIPGHARTATCGNRCALHLFGKVPGVVRDRIFALRVGVCLCMSSVDCKYCPFQVTGATVCSTPTHSANTSYTPLSLPQPSGWPSRPSCTSSSSLLYVSEPHTNPALRFSPSLSMNVKKQHD